MEEQPAPATPPEMPAVPAPPPEMPAPPVSPAPPVMWEAPPADAGGIPVPGAPGIRFAGMWPRAAAYLIDVLILAVVGGVIDGAIAAIAPSTAVRFEPGATGIQSGSPVSAIVSVAVSFPYFYFLWRTSGRGSLGQRLLGIQVGHAFDGAILTPQQAALRWVALGYPLSLLAVTPAGTAVGGLLNFLLIIALFLTTLGSPTRQGWHDKLANSAVVRRAGASNTAAVVLVVIVAIVVLLFLVALIGLIAVGGQMSEILSKIGNSVYPFPTP